MAALALGDVIDGHTVNLNLVERINTNIHPILYVPSSISSAKKIWENEGSLQGSKGI